MACFRQVQNSTTDESDLPQDFTIIIIIIIIIVIIVIITLESGHSAWSAII